MKPSIDMFSLCTIDRTKIVVFVAVIYFPVFRYLPSPCFLLKAGMAMCNRSASLPGTGSKDSTGVLLSLLEVRSPGSPPGGGGCCCCCCCSSSLTSGSQKWYPQEEGTGERELI